MNSSVPAVGPPWETVLECGRACPYAYDGDCDDGGVVSIGLERAHRMVSHTAVFVAQGAAYHMCALGQDCADCGPRTVLAAPPPPPGPPEPLFSHIPLSALLLLAWCLASVFARGLRARQLRRIREALAEEEEEARVARAGPVAVAVPVFTGVVPTSSAAGESQESAQGAPSNSSSSSAADGGAGGEPPSSDGVRSPPIAQGTAQPTSGGGGGGGGTADSESAESAPPAGDEVPMVVVQGRRITPNPSGADPPGSGLAIPQHRALL
jgi:hypothetical protein